MAEYIEREALMAQLEERRDYLFKENGDYDHYSNGFDEAVDKVENFPAADVVEVVRCKDCIHWYDKEEVCLKIYSDGEVSPYAWQERKPNDFCSYGERRAEQ